MDIKIPPPVVGLTAALLIWLTDLDDPPTGLQWTQSVLDFPGRIVVVVLLVLAGLCLDLASVAAFIKRRTTINPFSPQNASALVVTGFYRFTRNPMYLGMACLILALVLFLQNALGFVFLAGFVMYLTKFQILAEEKALEQRFGDSYRKYKAAVRRWI
ncbi:MAG: isoprenylcysteine carboxylmethyltransferase family protein [Rhodobacteraceae bacterium]|nr:isoprenylcysteine carboxylmethyltransferase family protein [Paracoccaceae bacterium]